jgi:hypothetical protein
VKEKRKLSWLALRSAREEHWQLFSAAKGNPEKMMWMLDRNKEMMKKWDEDSFSVTGWIEGDISVLFSEDKPKGSCLDESKFGEPVGIKTGSIPRQEDGSIGPQPAIQVSITIQEEQGSATTMKPECSNPESNSSGPAAPNSEVLPDEAAMQVDVQLTKE